MLSVDILNVVILVVLHPIEPIMLYVVILAVVRLSVVAPSICSQKASFTSAVRHKFDLIVNVTTRCNINRRVECR